MPRLYNPADTSIYCRTIGRYILPRESVTITDDEARGIRNIQALILEPDPADTATARVFVRRASELVEVSDPPERETR